MNKDNKYLLKHISDLSEQSVNRNIILYSDFLSINEISDILDVADTFRSNLKLLGGYEMSERKIAAFIPDDCYMALEPPIVCVCFMPLSAKYKDNLTHRDVLGTLMNLGLDRSKYGDIIVTDDYVYVFCLKSAADIIIEEINRIKHTSVAGQIINIEKFEYKPNRIEKISSVASNRLDAILADILNVSRSKALEAIQSEKVFINGKVVLNSTQKLNHDDILSIRGFGKLQFDDFIGRSKKGKLRYRYYLYA